MVLRRALPLFVVLMVGAVGLGGQSVQSLPQFPVAWAQTEPGTDPQTPPQTLPSSNPDEVASPEATFSGATSEEIEAATTRYFAAVEAYRLEENRYNLARDQYYQLNTLAALDEAIRRSKEVLRARAEVLQSYFSYLRLILQNTKGIDLDDKARADQALQTWQIELETYVQQIPAATNREQVNALFSQINVRSKEIRHSAYGTLVLIKIGEIQTAVDTATLLSERTGRAVESSETISAANKEIAERGLEEIRTLLQRANNNTFTLLEDYRERNGRGDFSESNYRGFQTSAEFSYRQLRQVVDYLREIQKDL